MVKPDDSATRLFALVPCAGVGERSGAALPKQYAQVAGRPMVAHTLAALQTVPQLQATLVVLARDDRLFDTCMADFAGEGIWSERCGGASRAESVANGLDALLRRGAREHDWVLVHDAARCLLRAEWVERLIDACAGDAVGGLLAMPLGDTLKKAAHDGRVAATLDRTDKWAAQTPQMFRAGLLRDALRAAGPAVTDDSSAIEALGHAPLLVRGEAENFKLTWPCDFELASRLLRSRAATP